jgi:hypothetical protein
MAIALLVSVADLIPRGLLARTGCAVFRSTAGYIGTAIDLLVTRSMLGVDRTVSHPRELRGERWKRDLGEVGDGLSKSVVQLGAVALGVGLALCAIGGGPWLPIQSGRLDGVGSRPELTFANALAVDNV